MKTQKISCEDYGLQCCKLQYHANAIAHNLFKTIFAVVKCKISQNEPCFLSKFPFGRSVRTASIYFHFSLPTSLLLSCFAENYLQFYR